MQSTILKVTGKTDQEQTIVSGVYRLYATTGIPLDIIFDCLKQRNVIPDWLCFYVEAVEAGMKHDRIMSKLESAITDSYGKEFGDVVIERLELVAKGYDNEKD